MCVTFNSCVFGSRYTTAVGLLFARAFSGRYLLLKLALTETAENKIACFAIILIGNLRLPLVNCQVSLSVVAERWFLAFASAR